MLWLSAVIAFVLAAVHLYGGRLRFLDVMPRSRWLSGAGGVSVAWVFVHVFPDLSAAQQAVEETGKLGLHWLETHAYLLSLLGLVVFYGLERQVKRARRRSQRLGLGDVLSRGTFWLNIGAFACYNFLIGYLLLHRETPGIRNLAFYGLALSLHFLVNDYGLRHDHRAIYDRIGRWLLAGAAIAGWALGFLVEIHRAATALLYAFLAGGIILNTLKEELPEERESNFLAFFLGAGIYAGLLTLT